MTITTSTLVADIATASPAHHQGLPAPPDRLLLRRPHPPRRGLRCAPGLDVAGADRRARAGAERDASWTVDWTTASLAASSRTSRRGFIARWRRRCRGCARWWTRSSVAHGARLPAPEQLQATFAELQHELLDHMKKEDVVLSRPSWRSKTERAGTGRGWTWIDQPIAGDGSRTRLGGRGAGAHRRADRRPRAARDACPTFRGLYHGLAELEREMHLHVHLENHILFPRAAALARSRPAAGTGTPDATAPAAFGGRAQVADADDGRRLRPPRRSVARGGGARGLRAGLAVVARDRSRGLPWPGVRSPTGGHEAAHDDEGRAQRDDRDDDGLPVERHGDPQLMPAARRP